MSWDGSRGERQFPGFLISSLLLALLDRVLWCWAAERGHSQAHPKQSKQYFKYLMASFVIHGELTSERASFAVFKYQLDLNNSEIHSLEPALTFALVS